MSDCLNCNELNNSVVTIHEPQDSYCEQCTASNVCVETIDTKCVVYHSDNAEPTRLENLGMFNGSTAEEIFEAIDDLVGNNFIGPSGTSGTSGLSGTAGVAGTSGTSGSNGTSGAAGAAGTSGINGTSGIAGTSGTSATSFANDFNDIYLISGDITFDEVTMGGKVLVSNYAGGDSVITITMPVLSSIGDCRFKIQTYNGTQRYIALQLNAADTISVYNDDLNIIYLGKCEVGDFLIKSNEIYTISSLTGYDKLGQRIWGDKIEINTLRRDGTLYNQEDVPRLVQFARTISNLVTEIQWSSSSLENGETVYPYKGYFAIDDISATPTIRVPDDSNRFMRALRTDSGDTERLTQGPGGYQHHAFEEHNHTGTYRRGRSDDNESGVSDNYLRTPGASGGTALGNITVDVDNAGDEESRGLNTGLLPLVNI